jgi:hypothetical protein
MDDFVNKIHGGDFLWYYIFYRKFLKILFKH